MVINIKNLFIVLVLFCFANIQYITAQNYFEIDFGGSNVMCSDSITDSDSIGVYFPNENYTITVCPDETVGSKVQIMFATGLDIDSSDTLYVYDGTDPLSDPLLAKINNNTITDMFVNASFENNSGCLTLVFVSDGTNEGAGWVAGVNCFRPCQDIIPEITSTTKMSIPNDNTGFIDICIGDSVFFEAKGNFPQSDYGSPWYNQNDNTSIFTWVFGDGDTLVGTDLTSVNHVYDFFRKGYKVSLTIEDSYGCISTVKAERKVRISSIPSFNTFNIMDDTICFGESVKVIGGVEAAQSDFLLGGIYNDFESIPDDGVQIYETQIPVKNFNSGDKIVSFSDIKNVCIDIEHSNLSNLTISLICPNGSVAVLVDQHASGTDVYFGEPVDFESSGLETSTVGEFYHYCFSNTPEYGKMSDESGLHQYSYTDKLGNIQNNHNYLPEGSYLPKQSFSNLLNCPLNGNWKLKVVDVVTSDNGFIDNWGIIFKSSLVSPSLENYTPSFSNNDYAWSADVIGVDGDTAFISPVSGDFENSNNFSVIDNFGCSYDTSFTIFTPNLSPKIQGDSIICSGDDAKLMLVPNQNNTDERGLTYLWNTAANINDPSLQSIVISAPIDGIYSVTVTDNVNNCVDFSSISLTSAANFNYTVTPLSKSICYTEDVVFDVFAEAGTYTYEWLPKKLFLSNTNKKVTALSPLPGLYDVVLSIKNVQGCTNRDTIDFNVSPKSAPIVKLNATPNVLCALDVDSVDIVVELTDTTLIGCYYSFVMFDKFGDDWNGGKISVSLNNSFIGDYFIPLPGVGADIPYIKQFEVSNGDEIELTYIPSAGSWENEIYYKLYDTQGNLLFQDGPSPTAGPVFSTTATCPTNNLVTYYQYEWGINNTLEADTFSFAKAKPIENTEYSVTVTDGIGGCSVVGSVVVSVTANAFNPTISADEFYCLTEDQDTLSVANPIGHWIGEGIIDDSLGVFNPDSAQVGVHWIYYVIEGGCGATDSVKINVIETESVKITAVGEYCVHDAVDTLIGFPIGGIWSGLGIIDTLLGIFNPDFILGDRDIIYEFSKCSTKDTITITVSPNYNVDFTAPSELCNGLITNVITLDSVDFGGVWSGNGIVDAVNGKFDQSQAQLGFNVITYEFTAGCKDTKTDSIFVGIQKAAKIDSIGVVCSSKPIFELNITGESEGVWSGTMLSTSGMFDPSIALIGKNEIIFTTTGGCDIADTTEIIVTEAPSISFEVTNESCKLANDGKIEVSSDGGEIPYMYLWSNGETTVVIKDVVPDLYFVTLTDASGCVVIDSTNIESSDDLCETPAIFVANIFSPNGDGANEVFLPKGKKVASFNLVIYNRWGEKVFEGTNQGWNGYYKDKPALTGVYVYYVNYELHNGQKDEFNGTVTLVK